VGICTVILSDNDPYIGVERAKAIFRATLDPKIIIEPGHGHFNEDDRLVELPSALAAVIS
jgi:predicted alpha/beta hydrolase family esterase